MHMILLEKKESNGEPRNTLSNTHNIQEFLFFNKLMLASRQVDALHLHGQLNRKPPISVWIHEKEGNVMRNEKKLLWELIHD